MNLKYFNDFEGKWINITGDTGSGLVIGQNGWETTPAYSKLVLLLSQTGTADPTGTELENTFESTYVLTRNAAGDYRITFADNILSQAKTWVQIQQKNATITRVYRDSVTEIVIRTNTDGDLDFTSFELRLYN